MLRLLGKECLFDKSCGLLVKKVENEVLRLLVIF